MTRFWYQHRNKPTPTLLTIYIPNNASMVVTIQTAWLPTAVALDPEEARVAVGLVTGEVQVLPLSLAREADGAGVSGAGGTEHRFTPFPKPLEVGLPEPVRAVAWVAAGVLAVGDAAGHVGVFSTSGHEFGRHTLAHPVTVIRAGAAARDSHAAFAITVGDDGGTVRVPFKPRSAETDFLNDRIMTG